MNGTKKISISNYKVFAEDVISSINSKIEKGVRAELYIAEKNNAVEKVGIIMKEKNGNIHPVIYIEDMVKGFLTEELVEIVANKVIKISTNIRTPLFELVPEKIKEFDYIKDRIVFRVVNTMKNQRLLSECPHYNVLDLSIIFQVLLESSCENTASVQIRNQFIEQWGITTEELFEVAMNNTKLLLPATFYTMQHAFEKMYQIEDIEAENLLQVTNENQRDLMYVLTNPTCNYGAAVMIYPNVLEMIGDILCEDFCVIPSSVHEILIVPKSTILEPEMMDELVQEVNEGQLAPEEVLGTHVYYFNRETKKITY